MLFAQIPGHTEIKKRLIRSVKESRISHAQLFLGPEGAGGLPMALAYAQYILCSDKGTEDSCGKCPACLKSDRLIHPEIHFVYPIVLSKETRKSLDLLSQWREALTTNPFMNLSDWMGHLSLENKQAVIGVDESEEILRKLSLTAYEGEYKIMLIWLPEKMNASAGNKLLKLLEEPPDKTLIVLISENEEGVLRTLISRTQLVKINRYSDEEIREQLKNEFKLSASDAARIAYRADGSWNAALMLKDHEDEASFYFTEFRNWMRLCFKADMQELSAWVDGIGTAKTGREKQKEFLAYGLHVMRECLMLFYGEKSLVRADGEEKDFIMKLSSVLNGNKCKKLIEEFEKAIYHIERNGHGKIIFTDLSLTCLQIIRQKEKIQA